MKHFEKKIRFFIKHFANYLKKCFVQTPPQV